MAGRSDLPIRVFVTGAAGRVGQRLVECLLSSSVPVTGLVMSTSDGTTADRVVVGDARHPDIVAEALIGADAVVHLAAIPAPDLAPDHEVFGLNTQATFVVLDQAARAGIRRAVIASSYSATGLPFAPTLVLPAYLPVDEVLPSMSADPYALSKQVDELTAAMIWRRYSMSVAALRFPFLGEAADRLAVRAARYAEQPDSGIRDMWSYLDDRDAARACVAGSSMRRSASTPSAWPLR